MFERRGDGGGGGDSKYVSERLPGKILKKKTVRTPRNIANTEGMQEASLEKIEQITKEPRKQQVQIKRTIRKNESSTSKAEK